jgi:hypothetical protein
MKRFRPFDRTLRMYASSGAGAERPGQARDGARGVAHAQVGARRQGRELSPARSHDPRGRRQGAKIVVTTECALDGYAIADRNIPLDDYHALGGLIPDGTYFKKLAALAKELKIYLVAGMTEADGDIDSTR